MKEKKSRGWKIPIIIISVLLIIVVIATGLVGNYFYNYALNPNNEENVFGGNDNKKTPEELEQMALLEKERTEWFADNMEEIYLTSRDKLKLHGYISSQPSNRYVLMCHGYMGEAKTMLIYAKHFYENGFNILLPNARGHAKSEGDYIGMGWHERLDIVDWIQVILEKDPAAEIILFGVSMGAATVMMTSGEELPDAVKLVIEDCGYTSVWEEFKEQLDQTFGLPAFPILNMASIVTRFRAGYRLDEASAIDQVKKCKIPTLFIHGDQDTFVPFSMLDQLYNAAACEKEKLVIKGAAHGESVKKDPVLYWNTVDTFIEKHISAIAD